MNLSILNQKIDSCNLCSLREGLEINKTQGPTYGWGTGNSVMVVGIAPSHTRKQCKYPLSTDDENKTAKDTLFKVLEEIKWPLEKTYFTNLVKCSLPDNREPLEEEINKCFNTFFLQELYLLNPFAIVTLGKYTNDFIVSNVKDFPVLTIQHFSYICRKPTYYDEWKGNWDILKKEVTRIVKESRVA